MAGLCSVGAHLAYPKSRRSRQSANQIPSIVLNLNLDSEFGVYQLRSGPARQSVRSRCQDLLRIAGKASTMNTSSLQNFADRVLAKGRIGKQDVQVLQRDLVADGIATRRDAEILIDLDRRAGSFHA